MSLKFIKINPATRKYSCGERLLLSGIFLAFSGVAFCVAFILLQISLGEHQLNMRFEREGIQTEGYVSGFRYVKFHGKADALNSGHYPIVTITTPTGSFQIPSNSGHRLSKTQQNKLLWQKVHVLYLRDKPTEGRVIEWNKSSLTAWVITGSAILMLSLALLLIYIAYLMLTSKNE